MECKGECHDWFMHQKEKMAKLIAGLSIGAANKDL